MITDALTEPVLCAVSGGADSMYMLARLHAEGFSVLAAHFNHQLRGAESERDEAFVRAYCEKEGIPFFSGRGDVRAYAREHGLSLETAARELRYAFLEKTAAEQNAACIATAHTADDNAETLLLRLARGTGLRGLGGIPPVRGKLVRPVLDETREAILRWLTENGVSYVEDSTNASDDYARNRIRHAVVPVLREMNPAFSDTVSRTAALLREDEDFLQSLAERHLAEHGADAAALTALPKPLASRVVRRLSGEGLSETHVRAILRVAAEGGAADIPGLRVERRDGKLCLDPAAAEPLRERIVCEGVTELYEAGLLLTVTRTDTPPEADPMKHTFFFPDAAICGTMTVGARREGDRLRPAGRGCSKSLKQLFQEAGAEPWRRESWPVLRDEQGVLAVYGLAADERTAVRGNDKTTGRILTFRPITED